MLKKIELINSLINESVTVESCIYDGILLTYFEDGQVEAEFTKYKGVNQYGQSISKTSLSERPIKLNGTILADNREQIEILKKQLVRVLNPLQDVLLKYNTEYIHKEITIRAEHIPRFSTTFETNNDLALAFQCSFNAAYPFWMDQDENVTNIETWEGGIEFELEIPGDGVEFARRGLNELEIINYGDIYSPVEIFFSGPALNPSISIANSNTKEQIFIKVNKQIKEGETLYISTAYGSRKVEIIKDDIKENAFNYIDLKSTISLFNLEVGRNILRYSTEGDFLPQSVIIKYKNKYLSL